MESLFRWLGDHRDDKSCVGGHSWQRHIVGLQQDVNGLGLGDLGGGEGDLILPFEEQIDTPRIAAARGLTPVGAVLLDALLGILVEPGSGAPLLLPHMASNAPSTLHITGVSVTNLGRQRYRFATFDRAVQTTFDGDFGGVVGLLVGGGDAPFQTSLEVSQGRLQPLTQRAEADITIDILEPLDPIKTTAPTAIGGVLVGAHTVVDAVEEGRCISLADVGLGVEFAQRIFAVLQVLADEVVAVGHCAVVPAATEVVAQQNGRLRVVTLDVVARRILIPDAVEHGFADGSVVLLGVGRFELLEGLGCGVASAPTLDEYGAGILLQQHLDDALRAGRVGPFGGVNQRLHARQERLVGNALRNMVGVLVTHIDNFAQGIGRGILFVVHQKVRIDLFVGGQLLLDPRLRTPPFALEAGVGLDDGIYLHIVGVEQEMDHRATVVHLTVGHYNYTGFALPFGLGRGGLLCGATRRRQKSQCENKMLFHGCYGLVVQSDDDQLASGADAERRAPQREAA